MLSSSWLTRSLPLATVLAGLVSTAVWLHGHSATADKQSSSGDSTAHSRHPSSSVYSNLPFRDPIHIVLLSFVAHWLVFYLVRPPAAPRPSQTPSTTADQEIDAPASGTSSIAVQRNYVVSTVHAVCAVSAVAVWLCVYSVDLRSVQRGLGGGRLGTGDEWHSLAVSWSLGYFVYDTLCMALYRSTWSSGALLHHCSIGSAFLLGLLTDVGRPFHFLFLLEELSTVPLNLKSLIARRSPALAERCAVGFAVSFFLVRLGYGSAVFCIATMQLVPFMQRAVEDGERVQTAAAIVQFVMCTASRLLNFYWAGLIARKLRRALGGQAGSTKQRIRSEAFTEGSTTMLAAGGCDKHD